jgi:hypothetical protein
MPYTDTFDAELGKALAIADTPEDALISFRAFRSGRRFSAVENLDPRFESVLKGSKIEGTCVIYPGNQFSDTTQTPVLHGLRTTGVSFVAIWMPLKRSFISGQSPKTQTACWPNGWQAGTKGILQMNYVIALSALLIGVFFRY